MNTAEKVARLEALLQRVQTNAKQPRAPRRASVPQTDVAARAGSADVQAPSPAATAAQAASAGLEAQRSAAERASKEASERVAREAAEKAAALRAAADTAAREMAERSAKETAERATREAAERAAREAREAAERSAREAAAREAAVAKERAAKEAGERAAKEAAEKAAREAAAAKEKAAREATERAAKEAAAKEKAAKEAADKAAKEKAAKEAAAKEATAKEAADKAAKEKAAAAKEAADKGAKEKAAKEAADRAAKEATEKAAKERLERATKEAVERAAKTASEKAAKEAAAVPPKKEPSTIDELFAELELGGGEPTKSGRIVLPAELTGKAVDPPPPMPVKHDPIKDEPTFDAGDLATIVNTMEDMPTVEGPNASDQPTRTAPPALPTDGPTRTAPRALPIDGPTRVVESYPAILDPPTLDGPSIVFGDSPMIDRSPEPDEPTVIRRPSAKDQALVRGELLPDTSGVRRSEMKTVRMVVDEETAPAGEPPKRAAGDDAIAPLPIVAVGDVAAEQAAKTTDGDDKTAGPKPLAGTHEPKVALAEPLREAAEKAAKEAAEKAAEKAAKEAALRPKLEKKEPVREEITTASRRMAELSPELVAAQMQERERERAEKNESTRKKGRGSTLGLLAATILLVGGGVYVGMRNGWFETSMPPAPTNTAQTGPIAAPPRTVQPAASGIPTASQAQVPTAAPTTSPSAVPSVEPTAAPAINPAAAAQPGVPIVERTDETKKLNSTKAYLTLVSPEDGFVYVTGKKIGPVNQRHEINCGVGLVRFGVPLANGGVDWRSPPGMSIPLPCRASTTVAVTPSKGPWKAPGGNRLPGGGGGEDPY